MKDDKLQQIGRKAIEDRRFWKALRKEGAAAALKAGFELTEREQGELDTLLRENCVELSGLIEVLQDQEQLIFGYWRR